MENITPSYLTKDFLKRTLENGFKTPNIEVQDFTVSAASGKGENYTSEILRVGVDYKVPQQGIKHVSLIIKNVNVEGDDRECLRNMDVVEIETNMYTKVIPEIEQLFGNSVMIAPKCFAADKESNVLVFDDLKALGYELQDRLTGLDEAHCIVVMKKIARLHAGSMYTSQKNPTYADIFDKPMFNKYTVESKSVVNLFKNNFEQMISVVRSWPRYEAIVAKLEKISSNLMERGLEHCKRKEGELRVITHSDLWVNNMMFKYDKDTKTVLDVALVDMQLSYYGSLGLDVNYFFNTSLQLEVLKSKRTELLKVYYETLKLSLEQLNYSPIPSWEEVCKEVRAKEFYGLTTLGCVFPIIIMDKSASQNSTIETLQENSKEKHDAMFSSKRMVETLKYSLKRFDELGVLED